MNNTIKLLLFTILLCVPVAKAMNSFRGFGKAFINNAVKAQVKYSNTTPLSLYIEKNKRRFDALRSCPLMGPILVQQKWSVPSYHIAAQLLPVFEKLKAKMGNVDAVPLATMQLPEHGIMHDCVQCNHKIIIVDHDICQKHSVSVQHFVLAHELAHASKDHGKIIKACEDAPLVEQKKMRHGIELEADEEAVRVLGALEGGAEFFTGNKTEKSHDLVSLHVDSDSHPSHHARISHLKSLKKSGRL